MLNAEHAELFDLALAAREELGRADADLRQALIDHYADTGEKNYDGDKQLTVRVNTPYKYEAKDATEWAKKNATFILTIDKKAFEKLPNIEDLECVEVEEKVSAVIAAELT